MATSPVVLTVPEIRDYDRINAEVFQLLGEGVTHIVLAGVDHQRLLCLRLTGAWNALIEIQGNAGPELAAEMDAPGVTVVCRGSADDGAGRSLKAGRLIVEGSVSDCVGYSQNGGTIVVWGSAAHRAGLMQFGGQLIVLGEVGRLAGERQSGGLFVYSGGRIGPGVGRGHRGGRLLSLLSVTTDLSGDDEAVLRELAVAAGEYLPANVLPQV